VEDPRINVQSILSRHFILGALFGRRFEELMQHEIRFASVMNWLKNIVGRTQDLEINHALLHALHHRADNAEGIPIPLSVVQTFALLPTTYGFQSVPNYIEAFLSGARVSQGRMFLDQPSLDTFQRLWSALLSAFQGHQRLTILEPACGSANDYRFFNSYGIAPFLDYAGVDLCAKNIDNAKVLFPDIPFKVGNVFDLLPPDQSFDLVVVHDLFEHLSLEGLHAAVKEVCRVTRQAICIGFFQMDEIANHLLRPVDEYHWNLLSMVRMRQLFASHGFAAQVVHISTFLRETLGCEETHNPNAYTFFLRRA
jgi:SAM-dependent methyltransferase